MGTIHTFRKTLFFNSNHRGLPIVFQSFKKLTLL